MDVYKEVRASSREWWYHVQLRKQGDLEGAREREHQSTRDMIRHLRLAIQNGGFVKLGRGGWSLHYGDEVKSEKLTYSNCTVSGHGCDTSHTVKAAKLLGILTVDTRTIPDDIIHKCVSLPMGKPGLKERQKLDPDSSSEWLDYVPPELMARKYRALGATVYNLNKEA